MTFRIAVGVGVVGLLLTAVGGRGWAAPIGPASSPATWWPSAYWLGIAIAASIWNAIFHAAAALVDDRLPAGLRGDGGGHPIFILLFLPIALGMPVLFPWVNPRTG